MDVPWTCAVCGRKGRLAITDEMTVSGMLDALFDHHSHENLFSGTILAAHMSIEIRAEPIQRLTEK